MPQAVTELELHAYIDGELSPERAAAVEAAMAGDPALAERLDAWRARQTEAVRLEPQSEPGTGRS